MSSRKHGTSPLATEQPQIDEKRLRTHSIHEDYDQENIEPGIADGEVKTFCALCNCDHKLKQSCPLKSFATLEGATLVLNMGVMAAMSADGSAIYLFTREFLGGSQRALLFIRASRCFRVTSSGYFNCAELLGRLVVRQTHWHFYFHATCTIEAAELFIGATHILDREMKKEQRGLGKENRTPNAETWSKVRRVSAKVTSGGDWKRQLPSSVELWLDSIRTNTTFFFPTETERICPMWTGQLPQLLGLPGDFQAQFRHDSAMIPSVIP